MLTRRTLAAVAAALAFASPAQAASTPEDWKMADQIVRDIQAPRIPDRTFRVEGRPDGRTDMRPAIQAAISRAAAAGGGKVVLGNGT